MQRNWRSLIRPKRIEIDGRPTTNLTRNSPCSPSERGYGITLGNSLRRVLLSSIQGAAIVSVRFDNVLHEFSTVPGVKEDVTDIILNLKGVRLKLHGDVPGPSRSTPPGGPGQSRGHHHGCQCGDPQPRSLHRHADQRRQAQGRDGREDGAGLCHGQARGATPNSPRGRSTSMPSSRPSRR